MPSWMGGGFGWGVYVAASRYAADGRPVLTDLGNTYGAVVSYQYEQGTKRLTGTSLDRERINGTELGLSYAYDPAGNITSLKDAPTNPALTGAASQDNQCFDYDGLARLQTAWTAGNGDCAQAPSVGAMGGAAPYWTNYTYDVLGNRTKQTTHAADGTATTTTYAHGAGAAGPHAVTTATMAGVPITYAYDAAGNRTSVEVGGVTGRYTWDAEGELTTAGDTRNVYDADGNRLVRENGSGTTVYLGGQEILITPTGDVKATRYYQFAGRTIAVRTGRGLGSAVTSLINDPHGTPVAAVPNGGHPVTTPVQRLYTDPFGGTRGGSNASTIPGDTQFLGKTRDESTGLTLLGARYYDEMVGAFISVDPILDLADPQQWNAYAYAGNNPVTRSDPSGLLALGATDYVDIKGKRMGTRTSNPQPQKASPAQAVEDSGGASTKDAPAEEWWNPTTWSGETWQNVGATVGGIVVGGVITAAVVTCVAITVGICAVAGAGFLVAGVAVAGAASSVSAYHWSAGSKSVNGYVGSAAFGGVLGAAGGGAAALARTAASKLTPASATAAEAGETAANSAGNLDRVGRWMSADEYTGMAQTGNVQVGGSGTTHVAYPASPTSFGRQAPPGSLYVEFDVPSSALRPGGAPGWAQIPSPQHQLYGRLAEIKGQPLMSPVPACNIVVVAQC